MKTIINGKEVEGTVEEIMKIIEMETKNKPFEKKETAPTYIRSSKKDMIEVFEKARILYEKGMKASPALKEVTGRSLSGDQIKAFKEYVTKKKENNNDKKYSYQKRVGITVQEIMAKNKDMTRKEAMSKAHELLRSDVKEPSAYMLKKRAQIPKQSLDYAAVAEKKASDYVVTEFPTFATVRDEFHHILADAVKNIIANKGQLNYLADGYALGITDGNVWREFCYEFERRQGDIMKYFNVKGRFMVDTVGKGHIIRYFPGG